MAKKGATAFAEQDDDEVMEPAPRGRKALSGGFDGDGPVGSNGPQGRTRDVLYVTIDAAEFDTDSGFEEDTEFGLVSLTPEEELAALKTAEDQTSAMFALAKVSLAYVAGRKIRNEDMEEEELWVKIGPRARNIIMMAHKKFWGASDKGVEKARASFRLGKAPR